MSPVRAAIRRPVTVAVACLGALALGLVSWRTISLQLLPEGFEAAGMTLIFPYPNADPLSVERDVVRPVEEALGTVQDLEEVRATCSPNRARFRLSFSGRTDMDVAALEVRDRLERVRPDLPREAQRFFLWRHSASNFPDLAFGALIPEKLGTGGFKVLEKRLLPRLGRIDGVAAVDTWGGLIDRQAEVELNEARLRAHKVDLYQLVQTLRQENFSLPAGALTDGGRRLLVTARARFRGLEDLPSYPVTDTLRLKDLGTAEVKLGYRNRVSRMDGKDIVWVVVRKESGRNTVDVCRRVRAEVAGLTGDPVLGGFQLLPLWDAGESIEAALSELKRSIVWGGVLAVLVLLLFLGDWRATAIIATAIPFSVLVSIALLRSSGYSLNVLTLAGLTLAVGMLVDNAIVVVENVVRRREAGEAPAQAAAHGAGEVALAITLATATSVVVFLPLVFVADQPSVRVMIANLAAPISYGLLVSLLTALLVVPLFAARLRGGRRGSLAGAVFRALSGRVSAFVGGALSRRVETALALALVVGGGGWWLSQQVSQNDDEGQLRERVRVGVELDAATTLEEAHRVFESYERFLVPKRKRFGAKHVQVRFDRGGGSIELRLLPPGERPSSDEIRKRLMAELPRQAGVRLRFHGGGGSEDEGESGAEGGAEIELALFGPESEVLYELADRLRDRLRASGAFEEVLDEGDQRTREVQVDLNRDAVRRQGTSPNAVLGVLGYQLRGARLGEVRIDGEDVPLVMSFADPPEGQSVSWLRSVPIFTQKGEAPLGALARVRTGRGPRSIRRVDRQTRVEVTCVAPREKVGAADRAARQVMATFDLPDGYGYEVGGALGSFQEKMEEIGKVLALGVGFMFLLMGILFESVLLPLAVLPALPFALVGGYLALYLTGTPQDVIASLGAVVLAGIVVNNAIVLVDAINRAHAKGLGRREAILRGVRDRFRPVVLTAATTIVGLLPMAWQPATEGVMSYHSLARAVIGGLFLSTIGTLIAVPLAWALLDELRQTALGLFARTRRGAR